VSGSTIRQLHPAPSLLERLRGFGTPRPKVDPELAGGLRDWLEDSLAAPVAALPAGSRGLRVDKQAVVGGPDRRSESRSLVTEELIVPKLVGALFRQWITTERIDSPLDDAVAGISASGDPDGTTELVSRMSVERRKGLEAQISKQAARIASSWPPLSAWWCPRTQERISIPLCGGRIVLGGVIDLVVGTQATDEATVCLVEIDTRSKPSSQPGHLGYYALLETLRAGAPPARVAIFNCSSGELQVKKVDEHLLVGALLRVVEVVTKRCSETR